MKIIIITGGIASGKNSVADLFHKKYHIPIIDTDQIGKDLVLPGSTLLTKITNKFGPNILTTDNSLDRRKLRELIFTNPKQKKWLEQLLHPAINFEMKNQIKLCEYNNQIASKKIHYCMLLVPLVDQAYLDQNKFINRVLVVDCNEETQIERGQLRDKQPKEHIEAVIKQQISRSERLKLADDIIENIKDLSHLENEVNRLHLIYSKM
ncbi:MAG: dephospho-CoA kinase [Gammaproteobacteria bacterium]|nr:dephospho-CoA kinase [Gammaproteobacteria bacterium]